MNFWFDAIILVAINIAVFMNWAFVSQKEHYIAGEVSKTYIRWCRVKPINLVLVFGIIIGIVYIFTVEANVPWSLTSVSALLFPLGTYDWQAKLVFTNRVKRLASIYLLLSIAIWGIFLLFVSSVISLTFLVVLAPLLVDLAAFLVWPMEKKLQNKFLTKAKAKLKKVNPRIVAITGSYGKTSTKVYVKTLIGANKNVCASAASFNNSMGLSRAVNETLMPNTEVFVAEMGTYGEGEIAKLCEWVEPEVAVMTAIGPMHLERMKSLDNILKAKSEITTKAKIVVINVDDEMLCGFVESNSDLKFFTVGSAEDQIDADLTYQHLGESKYKFTYKGLSLEVVVPKTVHISNLACAAGVALYYDVEFKDVVERMAKVVDPDHRRTIETAPNGQIIIDDTFNLNPKGALEDLKLLKSFGVDGSKKVVVTPGMIELGKTQNSENKKFGEAIGESADLLVVVGSINKKAILSGIKNTEVKEFPNRKDAVKFVMANTKKADLILYANDLPPHYP